MQITEIYYEKVFPIAPYVNEKIGVKVVLNEHERDSPTALQEAFENAKRIVDDWGYKKMEEQRPPDTYSESDYFKSTEEPPYTPPERTVVKLAPDKAIRHKYAKAAVEKDEETIKLLENMYDFNAPQK